jgi:hypothetical protein
VAQYLNSLQAYQDQVKLIQDQFRSEMELYESQADIFQAEMADYQTARLTYESARATAVTSAESIIGGIKDEFGWAFVNKGDSKIFWPWLFKTWVGQLILIGIYFGIILFVFKRKDT